jgi:cell division protein FtsB
VSRAQHKQKSAGARALTHAAEFLYRMRRRIATGVAVLAALPIGYHAIWGENGINVYEQRLAESQSIQKRIDILQQENTRLQQQVDELKNDPDAIEHEARERLHYARPGEVIWTEDDQPATASPSLPPAKK